MSYSRFLKREVSEDTGLGGFLLYAAMGMGRKALSNLRRNRSLASIDRTTDLVEKRYDHYRSKIPLGSFDDYVLGTLPRDFTVVDDRVQFTDSRRAVAGYLGVLHDLVRRYARDGAVVEFGCGGGRNLFYLAKHGIKNPLVGLEVSGASVDLARRASDHFGLPARFEKCDVSKALPDIRTVDVVSASMPLR